MPLDALEDACTYSDRVMVASVDHCEWGEDPQSWSGAFRRCRFAMLELLKDESSSLDYSGPISSGDCGITLLEGEKHLLFLDSENRPHPLSTPLPRRSRFNERIEAWLSLLRRYRDGGATDLAEPWVFSRSVTQVCTLVQQPKHGHRLEYTRRPPHAVRLAELDWDRLEKDLAGSLSPEQIADFRRRLTAMPEPPTDRDHTLRVSFRARQTGVARDMTLRVGDQSWAVDREAVYRGPHSKTISEFTYSLSGDAVLEVLDALEARTDVVVSGLLTANPDPRWAVSFETKTTNMGAALSDYRACNTPEAGATSPAD